MANPSNDYILVIYDLDIRSWERYSSISALQPDTGCERISTRHAANAVTATPYLSHTGASSAQICAPVDTVLDHPVHDNCARHLHHESAIITVE